MTAAPTECYGRYALVERIGTGGMAEVWRARLQAAAGVEKLLVIKRMLPDLAARPGFVEMFVDEARMAAAFQHANIVQVFDFGEVDGRYFMAMEHVVGTDLASVLRAVADQRVVLPAEYVAYVGHEVCRALAYAHDLTDASGGFAGERDLPDLFDDFAMPATPPSATRPSPGNSTASAQPSAHPEVPADTPAHVTITLRSGWGYASIDGKRLDDRPPVVDHALAPGTHLVRVEKPNTGRVYSRQVTLAPGESVEVVFD